MKKLVVAIFALCLMLSAPALSATPATDNTQPTDAEIMAWMLPAGVGMLAVMDMMSKPVDTAAADNTKPGATEITTNMPPICPVMSYAVDNLVSKPVDTAQTPSERFVAEWKALPFEEKVFIIAAEIIRQYRCEKEPQEGQQCVLN